MRGRFFPGFRPATPEQTQAYQQHHFDLFRNSRYESKLRTAGGKRAITDESPRYQRLNDQAGRSGAPLSRTQQWWHWNRALTKEDRDFMRMQRASERQTRQHRRTR